MILGQPWMKKHRVIIDMTNHFLAYWSSYYRYVRATFQLNSPSLPMKTIAVKIEKNITP